MVAGEMMVEAAEDDYNVGGEGGIKKYTTWGQVVYFLGYWMCVGLFVGEDVEDFDVEYQCFVGADELSGAVDAVG